MPRLLPDRMVPFGRQDAGHGLEHAPCRRAHDQERRQRQHQRYRQRQRSPPGNRQPGQQQQPRQRRSKRRRPLGIPADRQRQPGEQRDRGIAEPGRRLARRASHSLPRAPFAASSGGLPRRCSNCHQLSLARRWSSSLGRRNQKAIASCLSTRKTLVSDPGDHGNRICSARTLSTLLADWLSRMASELRFAAAEGRCSWACAQLPICRASR